MFDSNDARSLRQHFKRNESPQQQYEGNNRRAIGLLPDPKDEQSVLKPGTTGPNRQRLLVALEADQRSCCLKMESHKRKSRGAILVFRGRVLGTIYGSKSLEEQLLDQQAYAKVCNDIVEPESSVDTYSLDEELIIAAASLFHGKPFQLSGDTTIDYVFAAYVKTLIQSNMPGCVVVSNFEHMAVCLAYVFAGKLVGFYSGQEGWMPPVASVALNQVRKFPQASVTGSMLQARNVEEVFGLTFSLSGLADRSTASWSGLSQQMEQAFRLTKVDPAKLKMNNTRVSQDRFIPSRGKTVNNQVYRNYGNNLFSTNP